MFNKMFDFLKKSGKVISKCDLVEAGKLKKGHMLADKSRIIASATGINHNTVFLRIQKLDGKIIDSTEYADRQMMVRR